MKVDVFIECKKIFIYTHNRGNIILIYGNKYSLAIMGTAREEKSVGKGDR